MLTQRVLNAIMDNYKNPLEVENDALFRLASEIIRRFQLELTNDNVTNAITLAHGMLTIGYEFGKLEAQQK